MVKLAGPPVCFNLPRKYRPARLADVVGQPSAVRLLASFVENAKRDTSPAAFIFTGPTGVGKSAAAWALAAELGCDFTYADIGGVAEIPSPLAAKATYDDTIDPSGSPFSGRRPALLADSRVTVYDDLDLEPEPSEKWVIKWDRINERYVYWRKVSGSGKHVIKGISPGVTRASTTFTLGSPEVVQGELPSGTITVTCDPKIHCPSGQAVYARWDESIGAWTTADAGNSEWILKGYPDFDASKKMLLTSDSNTLEWNEIAPVLNWLAGYASGNDQSIGHDASGATLWQDDDDECPEAP